MIAPFGTTWDNRQLPDWPERTVVEVRSIQNPLGDGETAAQYVVLDCGHWLINSHGIWAKPLIQGGTLRCRTCGVNGDRVPNRARWNGKSE